MSTTPVDPAACALVRTAMVEVRAAQMRLVECVAELDGSDAVAVSGYRDPTSLVRDLCRVDPAHAKRLLADARSLVPADTLTGEPVVALLPATAALARDGVVGEQHVRVISRAMDAVRRVPGLDPGTVEAAEASLAAHAEVLAPRGVEKAAKRLLAHLDPDGVAPIDPPEPEDEMSLRRRPDGTVVFGGVIHDTADGELLLEVMDALSTPAGADDARSLSRRRAEALLDLAAQALTGGTATDTGVEEDPPRADTTTAEQPAEPGEQAEPGEPGERRDEDPAARTVPAARRRAPVAGRALLILTIELRWLRDGTGHALLDSGAALSAAAARRLACDAGLVPAVLGSRSEPLDVGRMSYVAPDALRRALHLRDRGCSFPGCTRRPRRCHVHHIRHWAQGGSTDPDNTTLLCRFHHHLVHHDGWRIEMVGGRPWYTPPSWIDPTRTPRPGGPHPPDPAVSRTPVPATPAPALGVAA